MLCWYCCLNNSFVMVFTIICLLLPFPHWTFTERTRWNQRVHSNVVLFHYIWVIVFGRNLSPGLFPPYVQVATLFSMTDPEESCKGCALPNKKSHLFSIFQKYSQYFVLILWCTPSGNNPRSVPDCAWNWRTEFGNVWVILYFLFTSQQKKCT